MAGIRKFDSDLVTHEFVVQRLPGGDLTLAKEANGRNAWGAHGSQGDVQYFPSRGTAKKALMQAANGGQL